MNKIVIVGGGAGGLELAIYLSHRLKHEVFVTLVNDTLTHVWKPLLHEIAAGTLNPHEEELSFLNLAEQHQFNFELGRLTNINRTRKTITLLTEFFDKKITPRELHYDILVLALGSSTNDFNIEGVREHCCFLDNYLQAEHFHQLLLAYFFEAYIYQYTEANIVIVGGGATGVELAAELHYAINQLTHYGFNRLQALNRINITIIEAGARILAGLPEYISWQVEKELTHKGIRIITHERVAKVNKKGIYTQSNQYIPCQLKVWAAGIKADPILKELDGLACNALNQLKVTDSLQTTEDESIFAMGDCAACPDVSDKTVPPRAQAAEQEARLLAQSIPRMIKGQKPLKFKYHDYGTLISLSRDATVGQVKNQYIRLSIQGLIARWLYYFLYKRHQIRVLGGWKTCLLTLAKFLSSPSRARLKLH